MVTMGGVRAAADIQWTDTRVSFQPGPSAQTGSIQVRTSAGDSNSVPFTARAGAICFAGPAGSDSNPGTRSLPLATLNNILAVLQPGEAGVQYGDPAFLDPAVRLFQLKTGSIVIDRGVAIGSTLDLNGNPRVYGAAVDLGAYEWRP